MSFFLRSSLRNASVMRKPMWTYVEGVSSPFRFTIGAKATMMLSNPWQPTSLFGHITKVKKTGNNKLQSSVWLGFLAGWCLGIIVNYDDCHVKRILCPLTYAWQEMTDKNSTTYKAYKEKLLASCKKQ